MPYIKEPPSNPSPQELEAYFEAMPPDELMAYMRAQAKRIAKLPTG